MKLYAIKYLSQAFFDESDEPFAGVCEKLFDTPQEAYNHILDTCIPEAEDENKNCYGPEYEQDEESDITFEVETGSDYCILYTYQDEELIETVEFEVCELNYNKEA